MACLDVVDKAASPNETGLHCTTVARLFGQVFRIQPANLYEAIVKKRLGRVNHSRAAK